MSHARLDTHLEVLRIALRVYLSQLREVWTHPADEAGNPEIRGILSAAGLHPAPDAEDRARVVTLLDAIRHRSEGPLARIAAALPLGLGDECLVAAAWWAQADPQLAVALGCAHDDATRRHASAAILRLLLAPYGVEVPPALGDDAPLVRLGVLEGGHDAAEPLRLTQTARLLLAGMRPAPLTAPRRAAARLEWAARGLAEELARLDAGTVVLRGPRGVGKRALAIAGAEAAGLVPLGPGRPPAELRLLSRARIAVPIATSEEAEALAWGEDDGPLIVLAGGRAPAGYVVDVPPPSRSERAALWRGELEHLGVEAGDADIEAIATRFALTEGDVAATLDRARRDARWSRRRLSMAMVWHAARRQPEHALDRLAALVAPAFTLDDLVLSPDADAKLRELVAHVELQHVVLDAWGFRRRLPRGQGVAALFAGPPGTGKTMAAEALAHALGQDLYRIDLSAVVSKYVGETEKNLATAFDEAERASAVLFFDEADALFGRRTEVRDAHDRYANLEVNYLLQRVETFTGLVVLASNRQSSLDEAFLRRLRFVIRFTPPDQEARRELWRRSFPEAAAVGDIDWDALAAAELTGGNIQSAALAAAYLAAANGGSVGPEHLEHALRREHEKLGRAWTGLRVGVGS